MKNPLKNITGRKRALQFHTTVPPNSTESEEYVLSRDATVEEIRSRFYPGQQLALHVQIYAVKANEDTRIELIEYPGDKNYLAGDDDYFSFDVSVGLEKDDKIVVKTVNTSSFSYDNVVNMHIDEAGGLKRLFR